nr:MAG: hypothetical protein [Bacteriophage sp.]
MQEIGSVYVGDGPKLMGGGIEAMTYAGLTPAVVIHYPDQLHRLGIEKGEAPERVAGVRPQHPKAAPGRGFLRGKA